MKITKIQGTLVALAAAGLFAGCAQKTGSGPSGTCGGGAAESKNSCPAHGNACKETKDKGANNCGGPNGCGAP